MNTETQRQNPYVGPRAIREGEPIFGRSREERQLFQMLVARRIALLHSPSGAGKTSLIQAGLIPRMRAEGFRVLPVARLNEQPPESPPSANGFNRYIYSLLLSLQERSEERPDGRLATLSLSEYLEPYIAAEAGPELMVLIIDQFEEVLTADPTDIEQKTAFFSEVGRALRNPNLWALFVIREDYLGALEPYTRAIPTRLANRFRLDLLGTVAAGEAIKKPAEGQGVQFADPAVEALVDDLCQIQVQQPDGQVVARSGPYVEPVQLQVVCRRLWQALSPDQTEITENDLKVVGNVDESLAAYYAERIEAIKADPEVGVRERNIRNWIHKNLYTKDDIRLPVLRGQDQTEGLDNRVIGLLVDAHLLRADERAGLTWYELAHDRLVKPVRADNAKWFNTHLSLLQRQAQRWHGEGGPEYLLLRGQALQEAEEWAQDHPEELSEDDQAFLDASRKEREQLEAQQQHALASARAEEAEARLKAEKELAAESALRAKEAEAAADQLRRRRNLAFGLAGVALALMVVAFFLFQQSKENESTAIAEAERADGNAATATRNLATAVVAQREAELAAGRATRNLATAVAAEATSEAEAVRRATAQADAEANATTALKALGDLETILETQESQLNTAIAQEAATATRTPTGTPPGSTPAGTARPTPRPTSTPNLEETKAATESQLANVRAQQATVAAPMNGPIVFDSLENDGYEIYVMDSDGSNKTQLTDNNLNDFEADFSPDGDFIVFERVLDGQRTIMIMNRNGGEQRRLLPGKLPDWSPDGSFIAYESVTFPEQLWMIEMADGRLAGEPIQLTNTNRRNRAPSWSPNGREIVFMTQVEGTWQLAILNVNSGRQRQITEDDIDKRFPVWSPDGELVAYNTSQESGFQVWVIEPSGLNATRLTSEGQNGRPAWSPDGRYLLFNSDRSGRWLIYRTDRDGSNPTALTSSGAEQRPDWGRR